MAFAFLRRWFGSGVRQRPDLTVVLLTRSACPLCDDAHEVLLRNQRIYGFALKSTSVDDSPQLMQEFGDWVPVVLINSVVRFRGRINELLFRRMMENLENPEE